MPTLQTALQASSWELLIIIGRQRGLGLDSNLNKSELIAKVTAPLLDPVNLNQTLARLSILAQQALTDLLYAGGQIPARYLRQQYGQFGPTSQLARRYRRSTAPVDLSTFAPLEELCLVGLVFWDRSTDTLFIPSEVKQHLDDWLNSVKVTPEQDIDDAHRGVDAASLLRHAPVDLLCHDLTCFLALLQRDDVLPLHGRWLPPGFLKKWGEACALAPASMTARSELQTGRRRFIHYLAESAGLVGGPSSVVSGPLLAASLEEPPGSGQSSAAIDNRQRTIGNLQQTRAGGPRWVDNGLRTTDCGPLTLSPAAWLWLNASRQERWQTLWTAWTTPVFERWQSFRLPGMDWLTNPALLLSPLHGALLEIDPADPVDFAHMLLKRQPSLRDLVPANLSDPIELLGDTLAQLLKGPLVWLGVLEPGSRGAEGQGGGGEAAGLRLTGEGLAWLAGRPMPEPPPATKFALTTDLSQPDPFAQTLSLSWSGGLPEPADLMVVLEVSQEVGEERLEEGEAGRLQNPKSRQRHAAGGTQASEIQNLKSKIQNPKSKIDPAGRACPITAASFIRALHRGWSPVALIDALNRLVDRPLNPAEAHLLQIWAEAADKASIRLAMILETGDPEVITRLASTRRGRGLIHRTLSPRAVVVDPAHLDQLVRRLTEQEGAPPAGQGWWGAEERGREASSPRLRPAAPLSPTSSTPLPRSSAANLWLALQVYQGLGRFIRLPVRLPQAVLDQVTPQLSPAELLAAEVAAGQILAALQDALTGRSPFPPWPEAGLPVSDSLAIIEATLAAGQALQMGYYTAGRDEVTHRLVEPYRLEWRGETPYLVGFCHRAQAERVFRLDRIRALVSVPPPDEPGQPWGE